MISVRKATLAASILMVFGWMSPSLAQQTSCTCTTPSLDRLSGRIIATEGDVMSPQRLGLSTAEVGTPITPGSHIVTGIDSSAQIVLGTCRVAVGGSSEVIISRLGTDRICVQVNAVRAGAPTIPGGLAAGLGMAGAAAIAGLASQIGDGTDSKDSTPPVGGGGFEVSW